MNRLSYLKYVSTVIGLVFSMIAMAQPDLDIGSGSPYLFLGDGQTHFIEFTIVNEGNATAGDGIMIDFTIFQQMLQFDGSVMGDADWDCSNLVGGNSCVYQAPLDPTEVIRLEIGVITQSGDFNFMPAMSASVEDLGGVEVDLTDNTETVDIEFNNGVADFDINLIQPSEPIQYAAGSGPQTLSFEIINQGPNDEGDQTTVTFDISNILDPQGAAVVAASDPNWMCSGTLGQIVCNYPGTYAVGFVTELNLTIPIPTLPPVPAIIMDAIHVNVSHVGGDPNPSNDDEDYDVEITPVGVAEIEVFKSIDGDLTEVVQGNQIDYVIEVNNTGTVDAANVNLTDTLPAGVTYQNHVVLGSNFACTYAAPTLTCNAPNLPSTSPQDGVRITVQVDGAINSTVSNTATSSFVDGTTINNTDTVSFDIVAPPSADLDISMDTDPVGANGFLVGDQITLDLTLHNPFVSTGAPSNVDVVITLPAEVAFMSADVTNFGGWACTHDGSVNGGDVSCNSQGNPVPIGTNTFIEVIANAVSPTLNGATVSASVTSDFDPNTANNTATVGFAIFAAAADLSLVFTSTSGVYNEGDTITYGIQVDNPMGSTASPSDATIDITLPFEVVYSSVDVTNAPDWSCVHDGSATGGMVNCDRGGVPFSSFSTHDIQVDVIADSPATAAIVSAQIDSAAESNTTNNSASQSDQIDAAVSNFSITKTVSGTDFAIGDAFTYVLVVDNPTASTASPTDVVISDQLPVDVSFDSFMIATTLGTTINCNHDGATTGGLFTCNTGGDPFQAGENVTIDINVTAAAANNNVDNSATVETTADPDGTANNNTDNAMTVTINGPLVTTVNATKTASIAGVTTSTVNYGQNFEYTLLVENTGGNDAQNVNVTDTLPNGVTWINTTATGWTCTSNANGDVDCLLDTPLAPGSTAQVVVEVMATTDTSITTITNQMEVNGDNTGLAVTADATVALLNPQATLSITQTPSPVDPGADVTFGLLVTNTGSSDLTGAQLNSQLPTGFSYNGFSGSAGWSCTENAGTVNCVFTGTLASNDALNLNLELTASNPQANQTYSINSTFSANELANNINESLGVAFSTSDYTVGVYSDPREVAVGERFKHIVTIDNTGSFDLSSVEVFYTNTQDATVLSVVSSDFNCVEALNIYSCTKLQPLSVGQSSQLEFTLSAGSFSGLISGSVSATADGVNKTANVLTTVINNDLQNDLALSLTASDSEIGLNDAFTYQVTISNVGSQTQSGFGVTNELPDGVLFQSVSGAGWACTGEMLLDCNFSGSLASNAITLLEINVLAPNIEGSVSNTATIKSDIDENPANNSSTVSVIVADTGTGTARADLVLDVQVNSADVVSTEQVQWQINIENLGPDTAENVRLSNMLPSGFMAESVQVSNGAECTLLTSSLVCEISSLGVNQSSDILLEGGFMSDFEGLVVNTFEVESDAIDPDPSNNIANREVTVTAVQNLNADLALELNVSSQQVQQGDVFELSFMAKNLGPDKAMNARIEGSVSGLIDSVQFLNTSGWTCQNSGNNLSCVFPGDFTVGMNSAIDLRVNTQQVVQQSQPIVFNASIASDAIDSQPANNMVGFTNEVTRTPTEDEIFARFQSAVGSSASETVIQSIRNVSSYCARSYFMAIEGLCEEFIEGATPENGAAIINAMEELTPNEVAAQSNSAAEIITSQFRNVGSRLAQLRGGGGSGFSVAGLNARYGNESIPLGMLAYLNQSEEEQQAVSNINDFVSPWGFFVNGSISMGERDATGRELGFDFDTYGLTAGVDYRFSPTKVAGLALGYANFDSEIEGEAEMQSTGFTLTGYGSFYIKDNFYVDGRISYGRPDFEQKRRINFTVDEIDIDRVAVGNTDADQYSVAMSAGYHFNKNSWVITPNASLRYVRTTIDAFQESGGGGFNFAFGEQEVKSMVWSLGASVSKAISLKNGVISPQFDFNFSRETENDGGLLEARFINAPDDEIFWIGTDEPDRTFGSAGVGLVFIGANGKQAYINYRSIFGLEGFTRGTINLGARFEF